jgi:hypothetical protein
VRLVHLSDLHLGDRPFRPAPRGADRRERDLAETFHHALRQMVKLSPDLVILSGDLFHDPEPPSSAFLALTRGVRELQESLPDVAIVAIAGERDTPFRDAEPGPLAVLDVMPGVEAAAVASRAIHLPRMGAHVLLVPFRAALSPPHPEFRPDPSARWNILVIRGHPHPGTGTGTGTVAGVGGGVGVRGQLGTEARSRGLANTALPELRVDPAGWDYVAIGGPHAAGSWGRNLHAAGSLERMAPNPWREVTAEKGMVVMDLAQGRRWLEPVPIRPVVELAPVRVAPGDIAAGTRRLRDLLQEVPGGIAGKLVRVRLKGDILAPSEGVDPGLLQAIRAGASHAEILIEHPPTLQAALGVRSLPGGSGGLGAPGEVSFPSPAELSIAGQRVVLGPGLWCVTVPEDVDVSLAISVIRALLPPARDADALPHSSGRSASGGADEPAPLDPSDDASRWADWVEASGEAEACAMEWAKTRQEASSRLLAYRERAKEIRERIHLLQTQGASARCPTCRRPLEEAHPGLLALLEEEWEDIVQDGTWWKRRRQQLEEKPAQLRDLEERALRLQPSRVLEDGSQAAPDAPASGPPIPPHDRDLLRRVGFLLQRATRGALLGVALTDAASDGALEPGALQVVEWAGRVRWPHPAEAALLALAVEWAKAERDPFAPGEPSEVRVILQAATLEATPDAVLRLIESGWEDTLDRCRLVVVPWAVARKLAAISRGVLEVSSDGAGRPHLRLYPAGRVRLWWSQEPRHVQGPAALGVQTAPEAAPGTRSGTTPGAHPRAQPGSPAAD